MVNQYWEKDTSYLEIYNADTILKRKPNINKINNFDSLNFNSFNKLKYFLDLINREKTAIPYEILSINNSDLNKTSLKSLIVSEKNNNKIIKKTNNNEINFIKIIKVILLG